MPTRPAGIVLAGGLARRMGGPSKPGVVVHGRAMVEWPLDALGAVCDRRAVVCKADTPLPELPAGGGALGRARPSRATR